MVCSFGMSDDLGKRAFGHGQQPSFLGRDLFEQQGYSEDTAKLIDQEVKRLVDEAYQRAHRQARQP